VSLDGEVFDPELRDGLTEFFAQALRRKYAERFDNAERMLVAWRQVFEDAGATDEPSLTQDEITDERLAALQAESQLAELPFSVRARNALDRAGLVTVGDLLRHPLNRITAMRGVGHKTRAEIIALASRIRPLIDEKEILETTQATGDAEPEPEFASVDALLERLLPKPKKKGDPVPGALATYLRLQVALDGVGSTSWPNQSEVAQSAGWDAPRMSQVLGTARYNWKRNPRIRGLRDTIAELLDGQAGAATIEEMAALILAARGSVLAEPRRSAVARAVVRAALETEISGAEPRFLQRRHAGRIIIATSDEHAAWAVALGGVADRLAEEDPLPAPARVIQSLRSARLPKGEAPPSDTRIVRLAAAASSAAVASSRRELYPRGMDAARALRLAQGVLVGGGVFTVEEVHRRVAGRYPDAAELPGRPRLDGMLAELDLGLIWDGQAADARGAYVGQTRHALSTPGTSLTHTSTSLGGDPSGTAPAARLRAFEEHMQRSVDQGAFLTLICRPRDLPLAEQKISGSWPLQRVSLETLLIAAMKECAKSAGADWRVVLRADAAEPGSGEWRKLLLLVERALPQVRDQILSSEKGVLLTRSGLLARYGALDLLNELKDGLALPTADGVLRALVLLVAADAQHQHPRIDGAAVPVITAAQWRRIPGRLLHSRQDDRSAAGGEG